MGPNVIRRITKQHAKQSLSGEPSTRRKSLQREGEFDHPHLAESARKLCTFSIEFEVGVEAACGFEGLFGDDEVASLHYRAGSGHQSAHQMDNVGTAVKRRRYALRCYRKIIVDQRTAQGDQVG